MPIDNSQGQGGAAGFRNAATITPHDTNELAVLPRALMAFTTAGIISVILAGDTTAVTVYLPLGVPVPVRARIVLTSGAVAAGITALW